MSFLLDKSAHARWHQPVVAARLNELLREDLLSICRPSVLEIGFSARSAQDYREVIADITEAMTVIEVSVDISTHAQDLQERLTHRGWHRAPGRWISCWRLRPSSTNSHCCTLTRTSS